MTGHRTTRQSIPPFHGQKLSKIGILDDYLRTLNTGPDEIVFHEGDEGNYVCFVLDGNLTVTKKNLHGQQSTVARIKPGRAIGEMALIDNLQRSATIEGETACTLRVLHRDNFEQLMAKHPAIAAKILHYIARSLSLGLRRTSNQLTDSLEEL